MSIDQAVILAAGEGTRMRPLSYTRPKVMVTIANKPILEHLLLEMKLAGINEFIFIVGYHDEQIRDYFMDGANWGVAIRYVNQIEQSGTSNAVGMLEGLLTGNFLVANGDNIIDHQDIRNLINQKENALCVIEREDVTGLGVIEVRDGKVIKIWEKVKNPPSHLANAGLYVFTPAVFEAIRKTEKSTRGEYELPGTIQVLIDSGNTVRYQEIHYWQDFSYPWDLLSANEKILSSLKPQNCGEIETNVVIKDPVSIGSGTVIRSGAYIVGPVIIGRNCEIGPHCYIRPATSIADGCHIGAGVEVKNSIIMTGSKIPHLNYVGDSIIGENCNLGAGTKIANLRLDKKNIAVAGIDTRRRKLGAIIGDGVETGINVSINAGTSIGNNAFIGPGAFVQGIISARTKIY